MTSSSPSNSGAGSRPTTDGTVDNIGAGKSFNPGSSDDEKPGQERTPLHKADKAGTRGDDSAPLGLRESNRTTPNTEPPETARENNADR